MATPTEILSYQNQYKGYFKTLNLEWIQRYFKVEEADIKAFEDPESSIIDPGGSIFFASYDGRIVGTCALVKHDDTTFELAKMAVSEEARGKGIGEELGRAIIDQAKRSGGTVLFLESNDVLKPAMKLYRKLGFKDSDRPGGPSEYERANIYMSLVLVCKPAADFRDNTGRFVSGD